MKTLADVLDAHLKALGRPYGSNRDRGAAVKTDQATVSKVLGGVLTLTEDRALKWSKFLYPDDLEAAGKFRQELLDARSIEHGPTVLQFCQSIVDNDGAVPVERISRLFTALQRTTNPLVCVEYRDTPRAARAAKYELLGPVLGRAIANGVSFAMFQPFGRPPPRDAVGEGDASQSSAAASYMREVADKCRSAYRAFRQDAIDAGLDHSIVDQRLRLYERHTDLPQYLGTAFQAKMFYVQYQDELDGSLATHVRLLQWVTTPLQDLLLYRGEAHIRPEAVRDTFFPVVDYFDRHHSLPLDCTVEVHGEILNNSFNKETLPASYAVWKSFDG